MKAIRFLERWLDTWSEYPSHAVVLIVLSTILALLAIYFSIVAIS